MNKSAIQDLNNQILEQGYTIEINLSRSVILDSYDEGELEESYYNPSVHNMTVYVKEENIKEELRNALNFLMEEIVWYGTLEKYYKECFNYTDNDIVTLRQINLDGTEPSEEEIDLWTSGEHKLYTEYTAFEIVINGTQIDADLISKLIESDEYNVKQVAVWRNYWRD